MKTGEKMKRGSEKEDVFTAIEIGTSKISVIVSEGMRAGSISILSVGEAPSHGIRKGEIIDQEAAAECVREALSDASEKAGVKIKDVWLALSASHLGSFNSTGSCILPEGRDEILAEDVAAVEAQARKAFFPVSNMIVHAGGSAWRVDGKSSPGAPVGMRGRRLECDVHIVHGIKSRIESTLRCLQSLKLAIKGILPSSIASAHCVLTQKQRELGALVIDMGGGTTDYVVYLEGAIWCSGVLPLGGDHISSDVSIGLRVPITMAEMLKVTSGSAADPTNSLGNTISVLGRGKFPDQEIDRASLDSIIYQRVREIFEIVRREIEAFGGEDKSVGILGRLGAFVMVTGGCSGLRRIEAVAEEVFGLPVPHARARNLSRATQHSEDLRFATTIGLANYLMDFGTDALCVPDERKRSIASRLRKTLKAVKSRIKKPRQEFRTSKEYFLALQKELDRAKNTSRTGVVDLDVPTFLRNGGGGVEIKHAKKISPE